MWRIFPEQRVVLKPDPADILLVKVEVAKNTPEIRQEIEAMPGVERVSPEVTVRFPVRAEGLAFRHDQLHRPDGDKAGIIGRGTAPQNERNRL